MAKIERLKKSNRGKEIKCSRCGKVIVPGMEYLKAAPFRMAPIIRCIDCGIRRYETSTSEYVQNVGEIVERWEENYGLGEETAENIASDLEDIKSGCEDSLCNMPEGLQEGDTGTMLQERIDTLEGVIDDLRDISYEGVRDEARDEALENDDSGYEYDEEPEEDEEAWERWKEEIDEETERLTAESYKEAINDVLSSIEY